MMSGGLPSVGLASPAQSASGFACRPPWPRPVWAAFFCSSAFGWSPLAARLARPLPVRCPPTSNSSQAQRPTPCSTCSARARSLRPQKARQRTWRGLAATCDRRRNRRRKFAPELLFRPRVSCAAALLTSRRRRDADRHARRRSGTTFFAPFDVLLTNPAHSPPPIDGLDSVLFRNCDQRRDDSGFARGRIADPRQL